MVDSILIFTRLLRDWKIVLRLKKITIIPWKPEFLYTIVFVIDCKKYYVYYGKHLDTLQHNPGMLVLL